MPSEKGGGTNGYTYFVCNSLGGPLSKLPAVKPTQIKAARLIKKYLTGKLDAAVSLCQAAAAVLLSRRQENLCQVPVAAPTIQRPSTFAATNKGRLLGQGDQQLCHEILRTASPGICQGRGLFCWFALLLGQLAQH